MTNSSVVKTVKLTNGKVVNLPALPKFITLQDKGIVKTLKIEELTKEELIEISYEWQVALLNKAEEKRSNNI